MNQRVRISNEVREDVYVHINNGGVHNGLTRVNHEFEDGRVESHLMFHAGSSLMGARVDQSFRIVNKGHCETLIVMLQKARALLEEQEFVTHLDPAPVHVQTSDGLTVEMIWSEPEKIDGGTKETLIGLNFRNPQTGEIVRYEAYNGPEVARMSAEASVDEKHDGSGYGDATVEDEKQDGGGYGDTEFSSTFDAGGYDEETTATSGKKTLQ